MVTRDRHNHFVRDRRDIKRTIFKLDIIIRNGLIAIFIFNGKRGKRVYGKDAAIGEELRGIRADIDLSIRVIIAIDDLDIGRDGIAIDQAGNGILLPALIGDGLLTAVIDLRFGVGRDGQRNLIVDGDNICASVRLDGDGISGRIAGNGDLPIGIAGGLRRGGELMADGHGAGLIVSDLGLRAFQIVMDGIAGHIQLPDGVKNVFVFAVLIHAGLGAGGKGRARAIRRSVPANETIIRGRGKRGSKFSIGKIKNRHHAIDRKLGNGLFAAIALGPIGLIGQLRLILRGNIVRGQGGIGVHGDILAGVIHVALTIRPVAEDQLAALLGGRGIGHAGQGIGAVFVAVRGRDSGSPLGQIVGQGIGGAGENGPDGLIRIQRLVDIHGDAVAIHPLDEGQVVLRNVLLRILIGIGFRDGGSGGKIGIFLIEGRSSIHSDGNIYLNGGIQPIGIEHQVLGGHGFIGEIKGFRIRRVRVSGSSGNIFDLAGLYFKPANKLRLLIARRTSRHGAIHGNILFKRDRLRGFSAVVIQLKSKVGAHIIQIGFEIFKVRNFVIPLRKAGDGEIVFVVGKAYAIPFNRSRVIQIVLLAFVYSGSIAGIILSRKLLQIIIPSVRVARPLGLRHLNVLARHLLKERVILSGDAGLKHNSLIKQVLDGIGIPHIGNIGVIFCLDDIFFSAASFRMRMFFFTADHIVLCCAARSSSRGRSLGIALTIVICSFIIPHPFFIRPVICMYMSFFAAGGVNINLRERNRIRLPREIHIQHGGAVRGDGDGFVLRRIKGEMLAIRRSSGEGIFFIAGMQHGSGGGLLIGVRRQNGIVCIVGVLAPIDDGVRHILRRPMRLQHHAGGGGVSGAGDLLLAQIPAGERVAQLGGIGNLGHIDALVLRDVLGRHAAAAVGIEGDPIGGHSDRHDIGIRPHDGFGGEGVTRFLYLPAGEEVILLFIAGGEGDLVAVGGNRLARGKDAAVQRVIRQEIDVVNVGEIRVDLHGSL